MKIVNLVFWLFMGLVGCIGMLGAVGAAILLSLPDVTQLEGCMTTTMYHVDLCPTKNHYVKLKEISPSVLEAVVASEDTAFYSHHGFDWYEIEQSFKTNLEEKHIHRGGSTITQQLAKNVWLTKERSYWRKAKEAYLTYELERKFDKNFILEKYLNVVEFGLDLYGVKDAAEHYFHKSPAELHLLDAVFLAYLLPNPESYSKSYAKGQLTPFGHKIIGIILKRLVQFKKITPEEYQFAVNEIGDFPWRDLKQADFENAHVAPVGPIEESSPEDEQAVDKFLNEDDNSADEATAPAPITAKKSDLDSMKDAAPDTPAVDQAPPEPAAPSSDEQEPRSLEDAQPSSQAPTSSD